MTAIEPDSQAKDVAEFHDAVVHKAFERLAVALKSGGPNTNPLTVTDAPPLPAMFVNACDAIGASKVRMECPVPAIAPIVTVNLLSEAEADPITCCSSYGLSHVTDVEELQPVEVHARLSSCAVMLKSEDAKSRPLTVTFTRDVGATLIELKFERTAASNVYAETWVPATAPTVTWAVSSRELSKPQSQAREL